MKRVLIDSLCGGLLLALTATAALAQATAQITGTVKDSSGGVLPGATVTATQTDTGFKREVVTDADGLFSFPEHTGRPLQARSDAAGFPNLRADRHRAAGEQQSGRAGRRWRSAKSPKRSPSRRTRRWSKRETSASAR